jgi:protein phosphatase
MSQLAVQSETSVLHARDLDTITVPGSGATLAVRSFGLSDPGKVRGRNEDQFLIAALVKALQVRQTSMPQPRLLHSNDRSHLFVVADGMGGHAAGQRASALAIHSVEQFVLETFKWFRQCRGRDEDKVLADFQTAIGQANALILSEAAQHPQLHGMGTTLTLAYSLNDVLFVAHAGDSRCYLWRDHTLYRLTRDHTLVEEMISKGHIKAEEAVNHQWRHVITNAVGGDSAEVQVEVHKLQLEAGDGVLLCSDGLTEMVSEQEIAYTLRDEAEPERACRRLVARANEEGGKDNITVIVARYEAAERQ